MNRGSTARCRGLTRAVGAAVTVLAVAVPGPSAVAAGSTQPSTAAGALVADTVTLTGLSYAGTVDLPLAGGTTTVLRLEASAASFTGLSLRSPCEDDGAASVSWLASAPAATASRGVTLLAVSLTGTLDGAPVAWSAQAPPPAADLGDATLSGLSVELAQLSVPGLRASGMRVWAQVC